MPGIETLGASLTRAARWYPDGEAFVQGFGGDDRRYTYGEANDAARRIANGLRTLGVGHGDRVALLSASTVEHALVHYGCTKLGAVPAAVHGREAPGTLADTIDRLDAAALVVDPRHAETFGALRDHLGADLEMIALDALGDAPGFARPLSAVTEGASREAPDADVDPDDVAFINFTSGTTGRPTALVVRHGQAMRMCHLEAGDATDEARILNAFSPVFMGWENVTLANVHTASTTVFHDGDVERVAELAERERLTRISLVTTPWRLLVRSGELDDHDLSSVESAGVSGEPIDPELYEALCERVTENVGTGYGLTETMGSGTALKPHQADADTIRSVGTPLPGCDVRAVEPGSRDPGATLPDGEVGEVIVTGPSVCTTVWEDGPTAADFLVDGWVFTGDRGRIEDGVLHLAGREDDMIISGGINVYPERVERAIGAHPGVIECAVVGVDHERWGEAVKAFVVAEEGIDADDLDAWCRERDDVADYQRPREYAFVDSLPRNSAGKLDRSALRG